MKKPEPGQVEERTAPTTTIEGKRLRGIVPYNVESRDLGGWREIIEPGALSTAVFDDLVAVVDHSGIPLGRYPSTLQLEDGDDGLRWAVDLPESRSDVREAVERGDLRAASWRMVVARDRWDGDVRHVEEIAELRDVSIVTAPAYPSALTEFRSTDSAEAEEVTPMAIEAPIENAQTVEHVEDRATPVAGGLDVTTRAAVTREAPRGLADEFRAAGFPGETATIPYDRFEDRAVTWTGSTDNINPLRRDAAGLGIDPRYLYTALQRVAVDPGVTSVQVVTQTARALASTTSMNRPIDSVVAKPETGSTVTVNALSLRQVANVQTGVPNYLLATPAVDTIIANDLRLALAEALDAMAVAAVAGSPFTAPGTNNILVSIRTAIGAIQDAGYQPDVIVLPPATAALIDTMVTGASGATADFINGPATSAPDRLFGVPRRISKAAAAPIVMDTTAFGRLYSSAVSLAVFEENAGRTNTSLIRLECHAAVGVERADAARRIAAA